ncbi:hypothetical protein NL676_000633 [Syzygium grande]|nr:hypothetical protein NL676_000633 [Syzygium grande]
MATDCRCFIFYFMMIALCPAVMHDDHARLVLVTESARRYPGAEATTLLSSQALAMGLLPPKMLRHLLRHG